MFVYVRVFGPWETFRRFWGGVIRFFQPFVRTSSLQNAFVQLSLAFRNDKYTLEMRLKQAERERNLTEEDTEKELEEFKGSLKVGARSPPGAGRPASAPN